MLCASPIGTFVAWVERADGSTFAEHRVIHTNTNEGKTKESTCFLEIEEGATFVIKVKYRWAQPRWRQDSWRAAFHIDGRSLEARSIDIKSPDCFMDHMLYVEDGDRKSASLVFKQLETTDDDNLVTLKGDALLKLGTIEVLIDPGKLGEAYTHKTHLVENTSVGVAHEKSKKLGGGIGKGHVTHNAVHRSQYTHFTNTYGRHHSHRIVFNYRTKAVLELMKVIEPPAMIAPAPSTEVADTRTGKVKRKRPSAAPSSTVLGDADGDEMEEVDEMEDGVDRKPFKRIKQLEAEVRELRRPKRLAQEISKDEVIDLTVDD